MTQRPLQSSLPDLGDVTLEMPRLALPGQRRPYRERTRRPGIADRAPTQDLSASRGPVRRIPQRRPAAISGVFGRLCDAWRQGVRSRPFRCFLGWVGENSVWQQPRIHAPKKRRPQFAASSSSSSTFDLVELGVGCVAKLIALGRARRRRALAPRDLAASSSSSTTGPRPLPCTCPALALHLPCTCPFHLPLPPHPPTCTPARTPSTYPGCAPHRVPPMRDPAHSPMGGPGRPTLARARGRPTHRAAPSAPRESTFAVIPQALLGVWMTASGSD